MYGPNTYRDRRFLWEEMSGLISWWNVSWCVGGDFNVIFFPTEPLGIENYSQAMFDFYDFILAHGLIDLPLEADSFTWSNTP